MVLEGRQPLIVGVSVALSGLATISDALRFLSRWMMGLSFWWDDWCSLFALILSYAFNISQFVSVHCNLGRHTEEVADVKGSLGCNAKALYSVIILYTICMPMIKASIVLFYWRLLGGDQRIRVALMVIGAMLFSWFVGGLVSSLLMCQPIQKFWNKPMPGHCVDSLVFFRAIAGTNLATDVLLLALPVPVLWGLRRPVSERLALIAVFAVGAFVTVVSIIRMTILTSADEPDPLWANTPGTIWTAVETSIGVVCVNLPAMSPLFRRFVLRHKIGKNSRGRSSHSYPSYVKKPNLNTTSRRLGSSSSTEGFGTQGSVSDALQQDIVVTTDYTVTGHEDSSELADLSRPMPGGSAYQGVSNAWHQPDVEAPRSSSRSRQR